MTHALRLLIGALLLVATTAAAEDIGTVAATTGAADVGRGGTWTPAEVGMTVQLGDQLRTGADGKIRVVFRDDSVIDLSEGSSLVLDQQVFDPDASRFTSLLRLVQGKARAFVGSYYKTPGASYEVQTPTAVAGVRGTSFLVSYNPDADATDVVGINGQIQVRNVNERIGGTVYITANETTTVMRNRPPTSPQQVDERLLSSSVEALQLLALGSTAHPGTAAGQPLHSGGQVPPADRAPSTSGHVNQLGRDQLKNPGDVAGQPLGVLNSTRGSLGVPF